MKRSKPLRRTPMKRSRKTPKGQQPNLRQAYREANPTCEWEIHFPGIETYIGRPVDMRKHMPPECHHIWTRSRGDNWAGLIVVSKYVHDWCHANATAGRVLSLLVKCRKGEVDLAFWQKASGRPCILGWVESLGYVLPVGDWLRPYWEALVSELRKLKGTER